MPCHRTVLHRLVHAALDGSVPGGISHAGLRMLATGLVFAIALPVCAGTVYQWKDANGVTHFSDAPPSDRASYDHREVKDAPAAEVSSAAVATESPACITARKNLEHLGTGRPVGLDADGDGKPDKEMGEEERANQRALAEQAIRTYCTPAAPAA